MPRPQEGNKRAALARGEGIIGALPDDLLQHVLSFLPAQQAVRTCVLARRWRGLWKSATSLRITGVHESEVTPVQELREFVNHLLLLRCRAPIDTCELRFAVVSDDDVPRVSLWIRHIMLCQVRLLRLDISRDGYGVYFYVDNLPLASQHLTRLELIDTGLNDSFLDFAGCPVLEDLVIINGCFVHVRRISSKSLKRLAIADSSFNQHARTRIYAPSLVSLRLEDNWDRTPVLDSMPSLKAAFVRFIKESVDRCFYSDSWDCHNEDCQGCYDLQAVNSHDSVLLKGLSEAENLTLIDEHDTFIFRRDLIWCPTFSKLKTLLLNEYWCVPDDFRALAFILEHSPFLEILTLQFFSKGPNHKVEIKGGYNAVETSAAISKHLKAVEVKCNSVDAEVLKILKFLGTLNICKLTINSTPRFLHFCSLPSF
uniref:F-box domain-containing protein n=1 Tax=Triticum urartu TaxID=4572 RepID=A0A8R7U6T0_TRIUA